MDAYALLAALETARSERGSGIPISWSEISDEMGIHASAFSRMKQGRLPGPRTLRTILEWLEMSDEDFKVIGDTSLPIGGRDEEWDGEAATNRVFDWATLQNGELDPSKIKNGFLFIDPDEDPTTRQAYKLPFTDVKDGALTIIPRGMSAVSGGHGVDSITGASDAEKDAIKRKICTIYDRIVEKYDDWPGCPFGDGGDRVERKERRNYEEEDAMPDEITENETLEDEAVEEEPEEEPEAEGQTAAIIGRGGLSQSEDPRTQALVARVRELLAEGAVAVSIKHDLHPDVSAALADIGDTDIDEAEKIMADAKIRPRHVAIVDTAAFSDCRLKLGDDGFSVEGPVTFEGLYTGDMRTLQYGSLTWDDDLLPIPIIWDPENNDHDGVVVGSISELERVDGMTTSVRPETVEKEDVEAVTAAAGSSALPAEYFSDFKPTRRTPLTVTDGDGYGLRRVYGHVAPFGVCHRSDMGTCFQYPKDVDKAHKGFHTGQEITLSDKSKVRVGALTLGGKHIDPNLARQGVGFKDVGRHRDDANTVFAMVRAWEDSYGLAVSGVVMPGADEDMLFRAAASSPSVELWPSGRGRTLVGIHLVPTPAWPVAASAGGDTAQMLTEGEGVHVVNPEGNCEECGEHVENLKITPPADRLDAMEASLSRIERAVALMAADAMANVPLPDDTPGD